VPCLMDKEELYALRGIGPDDTTVKNAALTATAKVCPPSDQQCLAYSKSVNKMSFLGRSPTQITDQLSLAAVDAQLNSAQQVAVVAAGNEATEATTEATYNRPTGLGCSMSIMPWKEASKVFGRAVANTFLAVQIVVRNMDPDHEYLGFHSCSWPRSRPRS
jgi:hypothetical protein